MDALPQLPLLPLLRARLNDSTKIIATPVEREGGGYTYALVGLRRMFLELWAGCALVPREWLTFARSGSTDDERVCTLRTVRLGPMPRLRQVIE